MARPSASRLTLLASLGTILGFIIAIMVAPTPGKQTRERIIRKAQSLKKRGR